MRSFLRPDDPAHLVVVLALAARAGELVGPRFVPVVEEVAFVERHARIISRLTRSAHAELQDGDRPGAHLSRASFPSLALRQTVVFPLTLQPLAITRPMSIESVNRALAGDRLLFLTLQTNDKRRAGAGRPARRSAPSPRSGRWRRCRTAASTSSSKAWCARRPTRDHEDRRRRCARRCRRCRSTVERTLEVDAYVRRLHELIDRALSRRQRAVAGAARPGRRHRRSAAPRLPARRACST